MILMIVVVGLALLDMEANAFVQTAVGLQRFQYLVCVPYNGPVETHVTPARMCPTTIPPALLPSDLSTILNIPNPVSMLSDTNLILK
jgi:hypothetical protein